MDQNGEQSRRITQRWKAQVWDQRRIVLTEKEFYTLVQQLRPQSRPRNHGQPPPGGLSVEGIRIHLPRKHSRARGTNSS